MKTVFITGGARGIGREIALLFAERGWKVGISYHTSCEEAERMAREYGISVFQADLSKEGSVDSLLPCVLEKLGEIDVLVNNAGISSYGLVQDVSTEEFNRVWNTNFTSAFFLTKGFLPSMVARRKGTVLNLSSIWGQTGASCEVLYSSTKAAMIGFTKALAKEVAPSGITVNCIAPGVVETDMMKQFSDAEKAALREEIPIGRFTEAREVAELAWFLSSDAACSVTGQIFGINGGMYC